MTDRITKRREAIGEPIDMFVAASELLDKPGGMRERARRAIFPGQADPSKGQSLCNDLDDGLYVRDLYELAVELGLPATEQTSKSELHAMLSDVVAKSDIPPGLNESIDVAEGRMKKHMKYYIICVNTTDRHMRDMWTYLFTAESESEALYKFLNRTDESIMEDITSLVLNYGSNELSKYVYDGFVYLNETYEEVYGHEMMYATFIKDHRYLYMIF